MDTIQQYKLANREILIEDVKKDFDVEFKRTKAVSSKFFEVYDLFLQDKMNDYTDEANTESTISRYKSGKKLLEDFQLYKGKKLHFNQVNRLFITLIWSF